MTVSIRLDLSVHRRQSRKEPACPSEAQLQRYKVSRNERRTRPGVFVGRTRARGPVAPGCPHAQPALDIDDVVRFKVIPIMQVNTGSNGGLKSARAGIRFELYSIQLPVIADAIDRRLDIKILVADMSCIEPPRPLQGGARRCVTLACQK